MASQHLFSSPYMFAVPSTPFHPRYRPCGSFASVAMTPWPPVHSSAARCPSSSSQSDAACAANFSAPAASPERVWCTLSLRVAGSLESQCTAVNEVQMSTLSFGRHCSKKERPTAVKKMSGSAERGGLGTGSSSRPSARKKSELKSLLGWSSKHTSSWHLGGSMDLSLWTRGISGPASAQPKSAMRTVRLLSSGRARDLTPSLTMSTVFITTSKQPTVSLL
mmetsp:Transcript_37770/g.82146  ORF Transcript_37770/g.82146 Transcript_37770/m.82146 type:complete len:221 (+) Transcript_37770:798-1460(+)